MKRFATALLAGVALLAISSESFAGPNANAKIALHLLTPTTKTPCTRIQTTPACQNIVTSGNLYPQLYFAHVLVTDGNEPAGVAGLQFGIQYTGPGAADGVGIDIYAWTNCATLEFQSPAPAWPNSGAGNLVTWDAGTRCQRTEPGGAGTGVVANAGYFYCAAYTPGTFCITPRPVDGVAKVADCAAQEDIVTGTPSHLGCLGFGGQPGYNPCGLITPVENTTWSAIKSNLR